MKSFRISLILGLGLLWATLAQGQTTKLLDVPEFLRHSGAAPANPTVLEERSPDQKILVRVTYTENARIIRVELQGDPATLQFIPPNTLVSAQTKLEECMENCNIIYDNSEPNDQFYRVMCYTSCVTKAIWNAW